MKKKLSSEAKFLATLVEVNQVLAAARSPRAGLQRGLEILGDLYGVSRTSVVLRDPDTDRLEIEASEGLTAEGRRATWKGGEGITGQVVQTGRPVVVPRISQEPTFLHRTGRRLKARTSETTFICLPIPGHRKPVGAMNVDLPFVKDRDYDRDLQLFQVVATMFGQALRVKQLVEAERQRLLDENIHLKEELKERYDFSHIIGTSGPMRQVFEQIARVASTNTTVLIRGE